MVQLTDTIAIIVMTLSLTLSSLGDHAAHGATLARLREAMAARPDKPVGVMLDTKGIAIIIITITITIITIIIIVFRSRNQNWCS